MATIETVKAAALAALDEVLLFNNEPTISTQMAAKDAQIATLTSALATANAKIAAGLAEAQQTVAALQ